MPSIILGAEGCIRDQHGQAPEKRDGPLIAITGGEFAKGLLQIIDKIKGNQ